METVMEHNLGFVRVATVVPKVHVADPMANATEIAQLIAIGQRAHNCQLIVTPELSLTGYTCGDLFLKPSLQRASLESLYVLLERTCDISITFIVGLPMVIDGMLFNVAAVCRAGRVLGLIPKSTMANGKHFYETRWFKPASHLRSSEAELAGGRVPVGTDLIFDLTLNDVCIGSFGVEICEDGWLPIQPGALLAVAGAEIIVNLSASNSEIGKADYRRQMIAQRSGDQIGAYVYAASGIDESTGDVVFDGHCIIAQGGHLIGESERFAEAPQWLVRDIDVGRLRHERIFTGSFGECIAQAAPVRRVASRTFDLTEAFLDGDFRAHVDPHPFVPSNPQTLDLRCDDVFAHGKIGLRRRLLHVGRGKSPKVVYGNSGGLDSCAAGLILAGLYKDMGWDLKDITAASMPGPGTTERTLRNSTELPEALGFTVKIIPIEDLVAARLRKIGHEPCWKCLKCENAQARERTEILMDLGFVIGTGDLSELALGWCTYNGDVQSMYNPNGGIPKTLIRHVVNWVAQKDFFPKATATILDIVDTPISPELVRSDSGKIEQKTEDIVGPYELHDFFLWCLLRHGFSATKTDFMAGIAFDGVYDQVIIRKWLRLFYKRFSNNQYKRENIPSSPKMGSVALSPRGDWRAPPDVNLMKVWLNELDALEAA